MLLELTLNNLLPGCWPVLARWTLCKPKCLLLWWSASFCCASIRVPAVIAGLWPTVARNKASSEAKAIDLSAVKVLIFGADPTGPQHLWPSLPSAESISTEADTKRGGKTVKENNWCWRYTQTRVFLSGAFSHLLAFHCGAPPPCVQMYIKVW